MRAANPDVCVWRFQIITLVCHQRPQLGSLISQCLQKVAACWLVGSCHNKLEYLQAGQKKNSRLWNCADGDGKNCHGRCTQRSAEAVVRYYSDGSTHFILLRPRHISCSKSIGPVFFDALDGYRTEIAILLLCIVLYCDGCNGSYYHSEPAILSICLTPIPFLSVFSISNYYTIQRVDYINIYWPTYEVS